jgi:hypothetical protein
MKRVLGLMLGILVLAAVAGGCETRTAANDRRGEEAVTRDAAGVGGRGSGRYTAPAPTGAAGEMGYRPSGGVGGVAPGRE